MPAAADPFAEPRRVAELMASFDRPWAFCGGWGIDLWLGRVTRSHKDIDLAIARRDQLAVQAYFAARGWQLDVAHNGTLTPWRTGEYLTLPRHGIWARNAAATPDFVEILLDEIDDTHLRFRRAATIAVPLALALLQAPNGWPILAPEIALLYKSGHPDEPENQADLAAALPALSADQRAWLQAALARTRHRHPWLEALATDRQSGV